MKYKGKTVAVTGLDRGFIAKALADRLVKEGAEVIALRGDIRDSRTFDLLDYTYDYLFHFGAPSSQVQFKRNAEYCVDSTINGFINAVDACRKHGVKLIYPSTGLLSHGESNEYARCKKICEDIALNSSIDSLGLRIFATYGPGESLKRDFASIPYLFARDYVEEKIPVIFGDGNQVRDLIYIDDTVNAVMILAEEANEKVIDVGSGVSTSFNDVIKMISPDLKPKYINMPENYVAETHADVTVLHKYYIPEVSVKQGIKKIVKELENELSDLHNND